jgi:DNA-binding NtrC family response regulator
MNVLVIDDEDMILGLTQRILERGGHRALLAGSGAEGLALMEKDPDCIAVAIIDMSMQGMSGLDTLAALRQCRPSLPVIISTGYATDDAEFSLKFTANTSFLQKPYKSEDLLKAVEKALAATVHTS